jgi:hypothetical protein
MKRAVSTACRAHGAAAEARLPCAALRWGRPPPPTAAGKHSQRFTHPTPPQRPPPAADRSLLQRAFELIDQANSGDPRKVEGEPYRLAYSRCAGGQGEALAVKIGQAAAAWRLSTAAVPPACLAHPPPAPRPILPLRWRRWLCDWVKRLDPGASDELLLLARGKNIEGWRLAEIRRDDYAPNAGGGQRGGGAVGRRRPAWAGSRGGGGVGVRGAAVPPGCLAAAAGSGGCCPTVPRHPPRSHIASCHPSTCPTRAALPRAPSPPLCRPEGVGPGPAQLAGRPPGHGGGGGGLPGHQRRAGARLPAGQGHPGPARHPALRRHRAAGQRGLQDTGAGGHGAGGRGRCAGGGGGQGVCVCPSRGGGGLAARGGAGGAACRL